MDVPDTSSYKGLYQQAVEAVFEKAKHQTGFIKINRDSATKTIEYIPAKFDFKTVGRHLCSVLGIFGYGRQVEIFFSEQGIVKKSLLDKVRRYTTQKSKKDGAQDGNIVLVVNKIFGTSSATLLTEQRVLQEERMLQEEPQMLTGSDSLSRERDVSKEEQQRLIGSWVEIHKDDFVAHAVWGDGFKKILDSGAVLSGEEVLRRTGEVEYEMGTSYGQRGVKQKITLSKEEFESLEVLANEEETELDELLKLSEEEKKKISDEEYKELKRLRGTMQIMTAAERDKMQSSKLSVDSQNQTSLAMLNKVKTLFEELDDDKRQQLIKFVVNDTSDDNSEEYLKLLVDIGIPVSESEARKLNRFIFAAEFPKSRLSQEDRKQFDEISNKIVLTPDQNKRMKSLSRKKFGLYFSFERVGTGVKYSIDQNFQRLDVIQGLMKKNPGLVENDIHIAYDEYKNKQLDRYLAHKFTQWTQKGVSKSEISRIMVLARTEVLQNHKLNCEIRTIKNGVAWGYGDIAVVRGRGSEVVQSVAGGKEALLLAPWQNEGNFFSLPLVEKNTIVIGRKEKLEQYSERLKEMGVQFAYIENFTREQRDLFSLKNS